MERILDRGSTPLISTIVPLYEHYLLCRWFRSEYKVLKLAKHYIAVPKQNVVFLFFFEIEKCIYKK